ncbi:17811_t:CDS:1, partial [Funneliformis geosporum]
LVPKELVKVIFLEKTLNPYDCGWTDKKKGEFIIFIPRKTCFFSHREMADTAVHEAQHVFT